MGNMYKTKCASEWSWSKTKTKQTSYKSKPLQIPQLKITEWTQWLINNKVCLG